MSLFTYFHLFQEQQIFIEVEVMWVDMFYKMKTILGRDVKHLTETP